MAGVEGLEPTAPGFGDRCSTDWATLLIYGAGEGNRTLVASLEGWSFTTKLHPQNLYSIKVTANSITISVTIYYLFAPQIHHFFYQDTMLLWPQKIDKLYIRMRFKQVNMVQIDLLCRKKLSSNYNGWLN